MEKVLYITKYGVYLGKTGKRFTIKSHGDTLKEEATKNVDQIVFLGRGKSLSIDAIHLAIKNKIPVFFSYQNGWPYGTLFPLKVSGTVKRRRAQYRAYNTKLGVFLVKCFINGKLRNQANLLSIFAKYRRDKQPQLSKQLDQNAKQIKQQQRDLQTIEEFRLNKHFKQEVFNIEAQAAKQYYWPMFKKLLPEHLPFPGRTGRGATDPVNSMLNFGYAILFREVLLKIYYAGLDPYAGFLHADRSGRESLALDLMEEFRSQVVDRVVLRLLSRKQPQKEDIVQEEGKLTESFLSTFLKKLRNRLETKVTDKHGTRNTIEGFIRTRIRKTAHYLVRRQKEIKPFILRW